MYGTRQVLRAEGPLFEPSRERKRATRSHRLQRARNTRLVASALDSYSSEAMNLVFTVQKRLAELVARFQTFMPGPGTWCCRSRSVLRSGSLARARGSVSDFHATAMNLVFTVQRRLAELVARLRSRLGFRLSRYGHEPGVAGPEASCEVGRSIALAARFQTFMLRPGTWCSRSRGVLLSWSLNRARGSVRRRRFAVVNATGHG